MSNSAHSRSERALAFVQGGAGFYGIASCALAAFMLFVVLSSGFGPGASAIALPVGANEATQILSLAADPQFPDAHFTTVEFTAEGLSAGAALLHNAPLILIPLAHGIVALAIMVLVRNVRAGRPFEAAVIRAITLSALAVAILGSGSQLLANVGTGLARWELLRDTAFYAGSLPPSQFDWTPLFIGIVLLIVARVFRVGSSLQRDTVGLVYPHGRRRKLWNPLPTRRAP